MISLAFPRRDLLSGVTVFLVALPLCLGIATASGVGALCGLVSGIVGGTIVALLSGSELSVSGPAAGLVVIVVSGIASLRSYPAFLAAVLVAGALQVGLGALRAGRLAAFVPNAVIRGMLASIGILLIVKQLPVALGTGHAGPAASLVSPAIAATSLALLFAWNTAPAQRWAVVRALPAPLVVVALGVGTTLALEAFAPAIAPTPDLRIALPALHHVDALAQALARPDFAQLASPDVWRVAITIAIVASLETLLSLEALEQLDPLRRHPSRDRELVAQGAGNMVAAALGGLPITAVIVRSSTNVHAGAKTRASSLTHGVLLILSVFLLTEFLRLIPLSCLAAILIHTGYKLTQPKTWVTTAREGAEGLVPFIATIAGVLATDLLIGIGIGVAASIVMALATSAERAVILTRHDDHLLLRFRKDVSFLAKPELVRLLAEVPNDATLIIDAERADRIGPDIGRVIDEFAAEAPARGITIDRFRWPHRPVRTRSRVSPRGRYHAIRLGSAAAPSAPEALPTA